MPGEHLTDELRRKHDDLKYLLDNNLVPNERKAELQKEVDRLRSQIDFIRTLFNAVPDKTVVDHADLLMREEQSQYKFTNEAKEEWLKKLKEKGGQELILDVLILANKNTNLKIDRQTELLGDYLRAIRDNAWSKWESRLLGGFSVIAGVVAIVLAIVGWRDPVTPPASGGGGSSGGGSRGSRGHVLLRAAAATVDEKSLKPTLEAIVTARTRVGAGVMPQNSILGIFADHAEKTSIDDQDSALVMFGSAVVDLPETRKFFWQDPSHMMKRIELLYRAYLAKQQLSDIYREAQKLEYDGKPIPFFETASLLQSALALVQEHLDS